jgi:hypothetical protein
MNTYPNYLNNQDPSKWEGYPAQQSGGPFTEIELAPHPTKNKEKLCLYEFDPNARDGERVMPSELISHLKENPTAKVLRTQFRVTKGIKIPDDKLTYEDILLWVEETFKDEIAKLPKMPDFLKKDKIQQPPAAATPAPAQAATPPPAPPAPPAPPVVHKVKVKVGATVKAVQRRQYEGEIEVPGDVHARGQDAIKEFVKSVYTQKLNSVVSTAEDEPATNVRVSFV